MNNIIKYKKWKENNCMPKPKIKPSDKATAKAIQSINKFNETKDERYKVEFLRWLKIFKFWKKEGE